MSTQVTPTELSRELRTGDGNATDRRRKVVGLSLLAEKEPWIPLALAAKVAVDTVNAGKLTVDQWTKHRAFCSYCLLSAAATFAMVPLVLPEARSALRQLTS